MGYLLPSYRMRVRTWFLHCGLCLASAWLCVLANSADQAIPSEPPPLPPVPIVHRAPRPAAATNSVRVNPVNPAPQSNLSTYPPPPPPGIAAPGQPTALPPHALAIGQNTLATPQPINLAQPPAAPRPATTQTVSPQQEKAFAWDALLKEYTAKPGELSAHFTFSLTNTTDAEVTITSVRTSCGCTVAKLPTVPWHIPAKTNGTFDVTVDLRGKTGVLTKTVTVESSAGFRFLTVRVSVPGGAVPSTPMADRARNMQMSMADRQAVFKGDCAACHWQPVIGKQGEALYKAGCAVCHDAEHRASMVPNLRALNHPTDHDYWKNWVTNGKPGTLMPAFGTQGGGPLTDIQIDSLVEYLSGPFQNQKATAALPSNTATQ